MGVPTVGHDDKDAVAHPGTTALTVSDDMGPDETGADGDAEGPGGFGVAVVDRASGSARSGNPRRSRSPGQNARWLSGRRGRIALWCVAVLGVIGTVAFGQAWLSQRAQLDQQATVRTVSGDFLLALTNFDAKNVDADFNRIQTYATGSFATQSNQFFGTTIRQQLETALASSRGQIRDLFVQSLNGNHASVYAVVDQTYVNSKMQAPAADVLQIVTDLTKVSSGWKISNVTVLNNAGSGASSAGTSSAGGSSSSSTTTPAG